MKVIMLTIAIALLALPNTAAARTLPDSLPTVVRPASPELVSWALGWHKVAARRRVNFNRARACFGMDAVRLLPRVPAREASHDVWLEAGRAWRAAARDYRERIARLRYRMVHPGGSGWDRWRPLVRWHWPASLVDTAIQVIRYESGGNPGIRNSSSGAAGLFQLLPAPDGWANPDTNVWYAYHRKYVPAGGWSPWYGCAAF